MNPLTVLALWDADHHPWSQQTTLADHFDSRVNSLHMAIPQNHFTPKLDGTHKGNSCIQDHQSILSISQKIKLIYINMIKNY